MDEDLTGPTGDLVAGLALFRDASVPDPGRALCELFAVAPPVGAVVSSAADATPARRLPVYKRIFAGLPSKVAAGALGFLLAGSVGAGALTGTMVLTSNDEDASSEVVSEDEVTDEVEADEAVEVDDDGSDQVVDKATEDGATAEEDDEAGANDAAGAVDLTAVPVPISVSDAAQTHDFDEACGNHGMYVSYFAQFGEEAPCAAEARAAAAGDTSQLADQVSMESGDVEDGDGRAEQKAAKAGARSDRQEAKADARTERKSTKKLGKGGR